MWAARADVPTRTNHPSRCRLGHVRLETRLPLKLKYTREGGAWGRGYAITVYLCEVSVYVFGCVRLYYGCCISTKSLFKDLLVMI